MRQQDYLDVSAAPDRSSFERRLVQCVTNLGFEIATAVLAIDLPGQKPVFITIGNTPDAFLEASKNDGSARRDPVLMRLKTMSTPFVYDQATYVQSNAGDLWEERRLRRELEVVRQERDFLKKATAFFARESR